MLVMLLGGLFIESKERNNDSLNSTRYNKGPKLLDKLLQSIIIRSNVTITY